MTTTGILATICTYLNGRADFSGVPVIQAPTSAPAPKGDYIAVKVEGVRQEGQELKHTAPGTGTARFLSVATLSLTEVEGAGDNLRRALQLLQREEFIEAAEAAGFTIWTPGAIFPVDTFDGQFFIRQWRGTIEANFADEYEDTKQAIEKVTGTIGTGEDVGPITAMAENGTEGILLVGTSAETSEFETEGANG